VKRWMPLPLIFALIAASAAVAAPAPRVLHQTAPHRASPGQAGFDPITHVVVIIQENRTTDDLFNGFCVNVICADTVKTDPYTGTALQQVSLAARFGLNHDHSTFVSQYDNGKMDGFASTPVHCTGSCPYSAFVYAPASDTQTYRQMATVDGVLSDETFEALQGPSLPAHLYAIAGQSGGYDPNQLAIAGGAGSCKTKKLVPQIRMNTAYPGKAGPSIPPCKDFETIFDLLTNAGYTWRYYANAPSGWWSPTQVIQHLYGSPNFIVPSTRFLTDVAGGQLANVTFVIPYNGSVSDHPDHVKNPQAGPDWVASIVNSIGETPFWNSTAIVVYWDDWGGFYDHVVPPTSPVSPDPFEYGFRVPLMVLSPYAERGTIDHTTRTFVSSLRFIEQTFKLPSLGTLDQYEPGLYSMLHLTQHPIPFVPVGGANARPFRHRAPIKVLPYADAD
jgi:phospholipase C